MFSIVGKRFTPEGFREYLAGVTLSSFVPKFVVVHNTAIPSLAQRPSGFTGMHMESLRRFYAVERGWGGGPHLFVDDNGVWVFNPLDRAGVHSPSWNRTAWGVELLGDFDSEDPASGRGEKVVANGAAAVAALLGKLSLAPTETTIKFHREDRLTDHACPGDRLKKADFLQRVLGVVGAETGWDVETVEGRVVARNLPTGKAGTGLVRAVAEALGASVEVNAESRLVTLRAAKEAAPDA